MREVHPSIENRFYRRSTLFYREQILSRTDSIENTFCREQVLQRTNSIENTFYREHILWRTFYREHA